MSDIAIDAPSATQLLMGNEAIARGALEGGVRFASGYPGTPSSEIIETLANVAKDLDIYVEWSVNEKVAAETAGAASFAGLRAITAMKQNGVNVAMDFLMNLNMSGIGSGFVLVACDDPSGISSTNEQDTRPLAKWGDFGLLEPASSQEAKDMVKWALDVSEETRNLCILRSVTRIGHARGNVKFGELPREKKQARFDTSVIAPFAAFPAVPHHQRVHQKLDKVREMFEDSPFNFYVGPKKPELMIITCGSSWLYSKEAVKMLKLEASVGILKLGTTWPLPEKLVARHLRQARRILVIEEVDPFLEANLKELAVELGATKETLSFYGKRSGHISPVGELNPDMVIGALANILNLEYSPRDAEYEQNAQEVVKKYVPLRGMTFCPGCPHRASFWAIKNAIKLDGRDAVVTGDIGCYSFGLLSPGYFVSKVQLAMGVGAGVACGLGKLGQFGFQQPVLALCGDSTFYHAAIPALINSAWSESNFTLLVFDNSATAMTGFQPHPGTGLTAMGDSAPVVSIEDICRSTGAKVITVSDPFDLQGTVDKLLSSMRDEEPGLKVLILRRKCALVEAKEEEARYKMSVDVDKCLGEACGCARFCTRVFKCPGLVWDTQIKKVKIDEAICNGCGVCADICPQLAITREVVS